MWNTCNAEYYMENLKTHELTLIEFVEILNIIREINCLLSGIFPFKHNKKFENILNNNPGLEHVTL